MATAQTAPQAFFDQFAARAEKVGDDSAAQRTTSTTTPEESFDQSFDHGLEQHNEREFDDGGDYNQHGYGGAEGGGGDREDDHGKAKGKGKGSTFDLESQMFGSSPAKSSAQPVPGGSKRSSFVHDGSPNNFSYPKHYLDENNYEGHTRDSFADHGQQPMPPPHQTQQRHVPQHSPVHNFSKPVPIPHTRSYDSTTSQHSHHSQQAPQMSPSMAFTQQLPQPSSTSGSYRNETSMPHPTSNMSSSYASAFNDFPRPTETPAVASLHSSHSNQMLYANTREAQPAQHTPFSAIHATTENPVGSFPSGWNSEERDRAAMPPPPVQHVSTNPFSPLNQPTQEPPPIPQQQQLSAGASPPRTVEENMRNLQEGSVLEGRSGSGRSNGTTRSQGAATQPIGHGEKPAGVIGRPTPPSQPGSQQSYHSSYPQSKRASGDYSHFKDSHSHTTTSPPSHSSSYQQPPAIPPKHPLDAKDREREAQVPFSYQQHLQRHLANASTSPGGLTGYGPPPVTTQPRDPTRKPSSPLSFREKEYRPFNADDLPQQYGAQQVSPKQERKASFGTYSQPGSSPHGSSGSQKFGGSPHGSATASTGPQPRSNPYSPSQKPDPPSTATYHHTSGAENEYTYDPSTGGNRARDHGLPQPQARKEYIMPPLLTPVSDGPAPPPAPSCPPPDTPLSEGHKRGPPGGFLAKFALHAAAAGVGGGSGPAGGTGEEGDGGTPTGFLPRAAPIRKEGLPGPPSAGMGMGMGMSGGMGLGMGTGGMGMARRRVGSGGSGGSNLSAKVERPGSAEGDDPIPEEYRPRAEKKMQDIAGDERRKEIPVAAPPMAQVRRQAPLGASQPLRSPEKVAFGSRPMQGVGTQRSPAEVGLGGYLSTYSKPVPPPSVGNSGTSNPRFPGGHISSPLAQATSPTDTTRESVMRGQWVDGTAAVSGPAPRKVSGPGSDTTPQSASLNFFPNGQQPAQPFAEQGPYQAYTQPFMGGAHRISPEVHMPVHPPMTSSVEDTLVDEEATNPSERGSPEIPAIPSVLHTHSQKAPETIDSDDALFASFSALMPSLPRSHVRSLCSFARYLREDALVEDKARGLLGTGEEEPQLSVIHEMRVRRWHEWTQQEGVERTHSAAMLTRPQGRREDAPENPFDMHEVTTDDGNDDHVPPPPRLPELEELGERAFHRQVETQYHDLATGIEQQQQRETPSPTPTIEQVANAPKVDLELQMPRPMPSVPAVRIDPSASRKHDNASTVYGSEAGGTNHDRESVIGMGAPGGTPYPFPFPKRGSIEFAEGRPVDTKLLSSLIQAFTRAPNPEPQSGNMNSAEALGFEIPPFLHGAYLALDQATIKAPLDSYLTEARALLEAKTEHRLKAHREDGLARRQRNEAQTAALYQTGRLTYADIERMSAEFEAQEQQRKMEVDKEVYLLFENEFVEVAYKDVKSRLEELGGRWFEEVRKWLYSATAADVSSPSSPRAGSGSTNGVRTALGYHLLLEGIDVANKLQKEMERHEEVLQSLVSERNSRYLKVSVGPLLSLGETGRAADAERRYWIDEQERQLRGKMERAKRVAEHKTFVDELTERLVESMRARFGEVLEAVWSVVWQFPPAVQPTLLRKFFDETTLPLPQHDDSPGAYTIAQETVATLAEAVNVLAELVALVRLAMEFRAEPAVRVAECQVELAVAEDFSRSNGLTAPAAWKAAVRKGVDARAGQAKKRVSEEVARTVDGVVVGLVEVAERLRIGVGELARGGGRVEYGSPAAGTGGQFSGEGVPLAEIWGSPNMNAGQHWAGEEGWGAQGSGGQQQPQQGQAQQGQGRMPVQGPHAGGLSVSSMIGGFRRGANTNANSMLVSPGAYSASGFSPGVNQLSGLGDAETKRGTWGSGVPASQTGGHGGQGGHGGHGGSVQGHGGGQGQEHGGVSVQGSGY